MISIGVIGVGTVGGSLLTLLEDPFISEKITVVKTVSKTGKRTPTAYPHSTSADFILNDASVQVVVEVMGTLDGYHLIKQALLKGKHVVTANKAVIDKYGIELESLAQKHKVYLFFEGAVAGGIPIIQALKFGLSGNKTDEVIGIVNGTTNYILTKMSKEKSSYDEALRQAQTLGFAESNPAFDVEGNDAAQKIAILASIAFSTKIDSQHFSITGITRVTDADIMFATELGYIIKLIARARLLNGGLDIRVSPTLVSKKHPLAHVDYDRNAIYVSGKSHITLSGEGAGGMPTASAVVSDLLNLSTLLSQPYRPITFFGNSRIRILSDDEVSSEFYIHFTALNKPGTLNAITQVFKDRGINILQVLQRGKGGNVPLILHVDSTSFKTLKTSLECVDEEILTLSSVFPILQA